MRSCDSFRFPASDRYFALFMHLDGIDLGRPLIEGPQVPIDADLRDQASSLISIVVTACWTLSGTASGAFAVTPSGGNTCDGSVSEATT